MLPSLHLQGQGKLYNRVNQFIWQHNAPFKCSCDKHAHLIVHIADRQINLDSYQKHHEQGKAQLSLHYDAGHLVIGPMSTANQQGCSQCGELRAAEARAYEHKWQNHRQHALSETAETLISDAALCITTDVIAHDIHKAFSQNPQDALSFQTAWHLNLLDLSLNKYAIVPHPQCPNCSALDDANDTPASYQLQSQPKAHAQRYRIHPLDSSALETYVDEKYGIINKLARGPSQVISTSSARIRFPHLNDHMICSGRATNPEQSRLIAIAEALERYGGISPKGKVSVRGSYNELSDEALSPNCLGLYAPEQYDHPDLGLSPYHPGMEINWSWGYSYAKQEPILVPEQFVYYALPYARNEPNLVYETSNGCAMGSCFEEAVFHGILEIAERDAFLMAWYAQTRLESLDLNSVQDLELKLILERFHYETDFRLHAFDASLEQGIPCIWLVAKHNHSDAVLCGAGAHPNVEQALLSAVLELAPRAARAPTFYEENKARIHELYEDSSLIKTMDDHFMAYHHPQALERLDFLDLDTQGKHIADTFEPICQHEDLRDDVEDLITRYTSTGMDVIVVDQSGSEHKSAHLSCVRVIIPGSLPMTFGTAHQRTYQNKRLEARVVQSEDLNPYPHPFY